MALTAMHRLVRRCRVLTTEVGVLHIGPTLLDRSMSMKTELMPLFEVGGCAAVEGPDHYGESSGGVSALLACMSWAGGASWDGRWAVAVCSHDLVAPAGQSFTSAGSIAMLVGRRTWHQVDSCPQNELTHAWPRPLQNGPMQAATHAASRVKDVGSPSPWPITRVLKRTRTAWLSMASTAPAEVLGSVPCDARAEQTEN